MQKKVTQMMNGKPFSNYSTSNYLHKCAFSQYLLDMISRHWRIRLKVIITGLNGAGTGLRFYVTLWRQLQSRVESKCQVTQVSASPAVYKALRLCEILYACFKRKPLQLTFNSEVLLKEQNYNF